METGGAVLIPQLTPDRALARSAAPRIEATATPLEQPLESGNSSRLVDLGI
jgi:hypothetical protein